MAPTPLLSRGGGWTFEFTRAVHEGYRIVGEGKEGAYCMAVGGAGEGSEYDPLVDTPYLFLEFARLHERRNTSEGGPGETVAAFEKEVIRANCILTLYEAVLSKDVEKLKQTWGIQGTSENALEGHRYFRRVAGTIGSTYLVRWSTWRRGKCCGKRGRSYPSTATLA